MIFCSSIWVQVLNRTQSRLALLRIPCSAFRPITSNAIATNENFPRQHKIDVILEESSDYWINVIFLVCYYVITLKSTLTFQKEVICLTESPLIVMKKAFYFIFKALFVLKIFKVYI